MQRSKYRSRVAGLQPQTPSDHLGHLSDHGHLAGGRLMRPLSPAAEIDALPLALALARSALSAQGTREGDQVSNPRCEQHHRQRQRKRRQVG